MPRLKRKRYARKTKEKKIYFERQRAIKSAEKVINTKSKEEIKRVKMEEEEETPPAKKQRRKRKPRRDSFEAEGGADSEENFDEEEEKKPKKRGRKKKKKEPEVPDEDLTDLQIVYKVVESLMTAPNAPAFLDRPDDSMYGMSDYYEVITKPMWLREVARKYGAEEYANPTELAADVRLMLENCYHYWGPCDTLSKRALKLEQLFENKIAALPEHVQKLCTLEATHGDMVKEEPDEASTSKMNKKGGYVSKLLNWVVNGKDREDGGEKPVSSQEAHTKAKREQRAAAEKELSVWEAEHLLVGGVTEQIASMWEFPVIGQFLHLVYNVLNIDPISHLELERMLLMPQASRTLGTLITSMLIPPLFRAKLEGGPAMPYSVWTNKLNIKVAGWYRSYHSKGDSTVEVFDSLGIEPQFWLVMGDQNPLESHEFHELTFLQRVWLLKGLCDFLLHNHKTIQDRINNLETEELREMKLGKDKEGYTYHYFPNFTEVRIYKMAKVPDTKWKNYEGGVEEAMTMCAEEGDEEENAQDSSLISGGFSRRPLHRLPRCMRPSHTDFKLACQSLEELRQLVDQFCDADPQLLQGEGPNAALVAALQSIITDLEPREAKMELAVFRIRNKMKNEWLEAQNRSPDFVDPGIAYWERKEKEEKSAIVEEKSSANSSLDLGVPGTSSDGLIDDGKRERRTRRESSLKMLSKEENGLDDESAEESPLDFEDDSEDEWFASKKEKEIKKKKEHKLKSAKKLKKLADISDKMQQSKDASQSSNSVKAGNVSSTSSSEPPVKIKEELPDPDDPSNRILDNSQNSKSNQDPAKSESTQPKKQFISVKKEFTENAMTASMSTSQQSVIQTLVPPVSANNVKIEKASKPIAPDLSKVKRSNSPDADVVYISDSEDTPDIKPNLKLLNQHNNVETINYVVPQQQQQQQPQPPQPVSNYLAPNQGQFVPMNVAQPQVYQPTQPITYQMQPAPAPQIVQQPLIRPNPTIVRLQATPTRPNIAQNQKFVVLQPNANSPNHANQFVNKGPRAQNNFPTTPTMQNVNWFSGRGAAPRSNATYSPRQRGQGMVAGPNQSPRGRGSARGSPATPPRGGGVQRFAGRTPTTPNAVMRSPAQAGPRSPSPMRGRAPVSPVRQGPVRNLNFNRSPAKPVSKPVNDFPPANDSPDIEGTLVVSMTDSGGFGYAVMLADGGKISLTQDQLAKIRSDNGGTLPKTCKVPLNMQTEGFRID